MHSEETVTRLHPRGRPAYTDAAALNDIHTLLVATKGSDRELLSDIAAVLLRTGRHMVRARDIDAVVTESPTGRPVARVDAEDTTVVVRQDAAGPGLQVEITTGTSVERGQLTVTLDGRCLYHPRPHGGNAA